MNKVDKKIKIGFILAFVGLIFFFTGLFLTNSLRSSYYFNNTGYEDNQSNTNSNTTRGQYQTAIIYNNIYRGVKITNKSDIVDLIIKDSVSQKANCPSAIKTVEEEIINKYGITAVNLCEMDVDFAKELSQVFEKIYNDYPSVRGYLTNLTLANTDENISANTIAAFQGAFPFATSDTVSTYPWAIKTLLILNSSYFLNPDRLQINANRNSELGWFPKGATRYSTVAHELGHYLAFIATLKHYNLDSIMLIDDKNIEDYYGMIRNHNNNTYAYEILQTAYQNYQKDVKQPLDFDNWRFSISEYAIAKDNSGNYIYHETIAEAFHDVYLNGSKAQSASQYIIATLKEELER